MAIQQLSIFEDLFEDNIIKPIEANLMEPATVINETVYIGQKAKIRIPEDKESEEYYYLKYYCTAYLSKTGEIINISQAASGKIICEVNFHGESFLFHVDELKLL